MSQGIRIAGFRVTVDPLLPFVILLIGALLTQRYIPGQSYVLGAMASAFLTLSILFHELGHAAVAQALRLNIERIHLFLFGGMAELKNRPQTPGHEALVALAGPFASFLLGITAWLVGWMLPVSWGVAMLMTGFLSQMNLLLALFNLIPIYPLDGGRALRALLWAFTGRYVRASVHMQRLSLVLIVLVMGISIMDILYWHSAYTLLFFMLAGYLSYTVFTARKELLLVPSIDELVVEPGSYSGVDAAGRNVLIPVLDSDLRLLALKSADGVEHPVEERMVIDMDDASTYLHPEPFQAEVIPVLRGGRVIGLADADELRFWLKEHHHATL